MPEKMADGVVVWGGGGGGEEDGPKRFMLSFLDERDGPLI